MNALFLILIFSLTHMIDSGFLESLYELVLASAKEQQVINYLSNFGYMAKTKSYHRKYKSKGLKKLQKFFKLPRTGVADAATLELIQKPRCGISDTITSKSRYEIGSMGFDSINVTYKISRYTTKLSEKCIDDNIKLALEMWGKHAYLNFTKVDQYAHISFDFMPRYHNDRFPFDGPGGVLAHANTRTHFGKVSDIHYDEEEYWFDGKSLRPYEIDFFSVTLHEVGHALGLGHSDDVASIMYPLYGYVSKEKDLDKDDIAGITDIYVTGKQHS